MSLSSPVVAPSRPLAPRLVVALLAAVALVLGPLAFVPASAAPGDPADISGSVALSGDEDLLNIPVTLERLVDSGDSTRWEYADSVYTDPDGAYLFEDKAPGTYRVKSGGPGTGETGVTPYAIGESAEITLDGADVAVLTLNLVLGGSISGTTTIDNDNTDALGGVRIIASRLEDGRYNLERDWNSDEDGLYTVSGLRDGTYQLDFSKDRYLPEYYDDIPFDREDNTGLTTITIEDANVVTETDAALTPAAVVSGVITGVDGPLDGIAVSVYQQVGTEWQSAGYDFTDEDGNYVIDLPAGSYRIGFDDQDGAYASEFFDDQSSVYSADVTTFTMQPGDTETADAQLVPGGDISGTVTGPDDQPVTSCVTAYGEVDGEFNASVPASEDDFTDEDGNYVIKGLAAGDYKLEFSDCGGSDLVSEFWDDQKTFAAGDTVTVNATETTENIDAKLAERPTTAHIEGVVTDTTSNGAKLAGITVAVEQKSIDGDDWFDAGSDTTNSNGAYDVQVDDEGTFRVTFTDAQGLHFSEFNGDVAVASGLPAPAVDIEFGDVKTVNAALAPASVLTGTLTRPIGMVCPAAYLVSDTDQSDPYFGDADYDAATYQIGELPAGEYKVRFDCGPQSGGAKFARAITAAATQNWYLGKTSFAAANQVTGTVGAATPLQPVTVAPFVPPVVTPPVVAPPAVVKVSPSIKVSAKAGKKRATLKLTVKARGVTPTGKITIKLGGKKLKTVTLKRGKASVTLKKLKKGKRVFTIVYSGDSRVLGKTVRSKRIPIN